MVQTALFLQDVTLKCFRNFMVVSLAYLNTIIFVFWEVEDLFLNKLV